MMQLGYFIHILAGSLSLVLGYIALFSKKGAPLHRRVGMAFVYTMLVMASLGVIMTIVNDKAVAANVSGGTITLYFVITGLTTVKPPAKSSRALHVLMLLAIVAITACTLTFGVQAVANGGSRKGIPAFPFFLFGTAGALAIVGDVRVLRSGVLQGAARLARHLWRISFALLIAAMSFFFGQAKVIPKPIRIPGLLALPVLVVIVSMIYWMWRVRIRRKLQGIVTLRATQSETAPA